MKSLNKIMLIGHLGVDPDVRYNTRNEAMVSFSLATKEQWKDKETGERKEKTDWHNVQAYRQLGEIAGKYLKKGAYVYVEGKVQTRKYKTKEGIERYITEVIASEIGFLEKKDSDSHDSSEPVQNSITLPHEDLDDDIPF